MSAGNPLATDTPVSVVITPNQKAAILAQIADLKAALTFAIGLTDDQRSKGVSPAITAD